MKFLVQGAELQCSLGTKHSKLLVPLTGIAAIDGAPVATSRDSVPMLNILPFESCLAPPVPLVPPPCMPLIESPWSSPCPQMTIEGLAVLTERSTCVCKRGGIIEPVAAGQKIAEFLSSGGTPDAPGNDDSNAKAENDSAAPGGANLSKKRDRDERKEKVETVRLVLDDALFGAAAGAPVLLTFEDGSNITITANHQGAVVFDTSHTSVRATVQTAQGIHESFAFLRLPPASSPVGTWQRLANLGYVSMRSPPEEPPSAEALSMAIQEFQADHQIPVNGSADSKTVSQIQTAHDDDDRPWHTRDWTPRPTAGAGARQSKGSHT